MSWLRDDIEDVRAFVLPDGIDVQGCSAAVSRFVLVAWRSDLRDRLFQVYLDHCFAGVTFDPRQRQLVVQIPSSFESAVRVEVISVKPQDAYSDFCEEIDSIASNAARVKLVLLRSQDLPIGATANVYYDRSTGDIDYAEPLNEGPIALWPCWYDKAGFGLAQFGRGDHGYDAAAAVGFARGSFGYGQFGLDAEAFQWISPALPPGRYRFGVRVTDVQGNESLATETDTIALVPSARPVTRLSIGAFDPDTEQLTLSLSDQP